ncbi:hypothetical protein [Streptomyces alfalfae]
MRGERASQIENRPQRLAHPRHRFGGLHTDAGRRFTATAVCGIGSITTLITVPE